jgi:predicted Zn-dependent peptidase
VDAILTQIDRLQRRRVLDAELRRAKRSFRGRLWLGLEDTNAVAGWYGAQVLQEVEVVEPEEAAELIDAVTADDLRRVAREYLRPERARLAAVGPVAHLGLESQLLGA